MPSEHVWVSSFVYDSRGQQIQTFEVRADGERSLLGGVVRFLQTSWAFNVTKRLVLDSTPEPGCYAGMVEYAGPFAPNRPTRRMVQIRMRRSHRLEDEGEAWWMPDQGPLDNLMPLDVLVPVFGKRLKPASPA